MELKVGKAKDRLHGISPVSWSKWVILWFSTKRTGFCEKLMQRPETKSLMTPRQHAFLLWSLIIGGQQFLKMHTRELIHSKSTSKHYTVIYAHRWAHIENYVVISDSGRFNPILGKIMSDYINVTYSGTISTLMSTIKIFYLQIYLQPCPCPRPCTYPCLRCPRLLISESISMSTSIPIHIYAHDACPFPS
jgi:hypothetical protein